MNEIKEWVGPKRNTLWNDRKHREPYSLIVPCRKLFKLAGPPGDFAAHFE
jgi:hypothetical protein